MSLAYPDIAEVTPATLADTYHEETEGTPFQSKACIEEDSKLRYSANGKPIDPAITILFPAKTNVHKGDYVRIIKLHGRTPTTDEAIRRRAKLAPRIGGSRESHVEVIV